MIWRRRRRQQQAGPPCDGGLDEACRARVQAEELAERVRAQWPAVRDVSRALTEAADRNHFAEAVRNALRGG